MNMRLHKTKIHLSFLVLMILALGSPVFATDANKLPKNYSPEFIQSKIEITGRSFFDYLRRLGISEKDVLAARGQKWLSVGEGNSDFTKEANSRGVDSWALDAVVKNPHVPEKSVIGLAQKLPFPDNSFDRVVSVWLIDHFFNTQGFNDPAAGKLAILEMIRVAKLGADIRINPINQSSLLSILDELKAKQIISYDVLPFFSGAFRLEGKKRFFELQPVKDEAPGSVRIVRLK